MSLSVIPHSNMVKAKMEKISLAVSSSKPVDTRTATPLSQKDFKAAMYFLWRSSASFDLLGLLDVYPSFLFAKISLNNFYDFVNIFLTLCNLSKIIKIV